MVLRSNVRHCRRQLELLWQPNGLWHCCRQGYSSETGRSQWGVSDSCILHVIYIYILPLWCICITIICMSVNVKGAVHMSISSIYFMEIFVKQSSHQERSQLIEVTTFLAPRLTMLVASYLKNWVWRIQREILQFSDIPFDTPKMLLESVHLFESCTWGNQATWMHDENTLQERWAGDKSAMVVYSPLFTVEFALWC